MSIIFFAEKDFACNMNRFISIGLLLGVYAYFLFILGALSLLTYQYIFSVSVIFFTLFASLFYGVHVKNFLRHPPKRKEAFILVSLLLLCVVNFIGALGPETGFDALWYHLTFPKLYLENQQIIFVPGGLLYYSALPKLTELLYIPGILFFGEIGAKIIHYSFGIGVLGSLYFLSRFFLSRFHALLTVLVFAGNLVFSFESITAYVDLTWTFYEVLAFSSFLMFLIRGERKWVILTGILIGLSFTTKLIAVGSLVVYSMLLIYHWYAKKRTSPLSNLGLLYLFAFIVPLPWFVFSYIHTGNPIYPFFTGILSTYEASFVAFSFVNPLLLINKLLSLLLFADDPVSPLYLIGLPLLFFIRKHISYKEKLVFLYSGLSILYWIALPESGGARFILPYLPVLSLAFMISIKYLFKIKRYYPLYKASVAIIFLVFLIALIYRGAATMRFIPYLLGEETKPSYLVDNLTFSYGDFYDVDSYFENTITKDDIVLLIGFHNLYYVEFPYVHESWYNGEEVTHVALQNAVLPDEYSDWDLVYTNDITHVRLYRKPS